MGNGQAKQTDRKSDTSGRENNNETVIKNEFYIFIENYLHNSTFQTGETQHRSFIVEGYDAYDDEGYNRNRTTSEG